MSPYESVRYIRQSLLIEKQDAIVSLRSCEGPTYGVSAPKWRISDAFFKRSLSSTNVFSYGSSGIQKITRLGRPIKLVNDCGSFSRVFSESRLCWNSEIHNWKLWNIFEENTHFQYSFQRHSTFLVYMAYKVCIFHHNAEFDISSQHTWSLPVFW